MQLCCPISATQDSEVVSANTKKVAEELASKVTKSITAKMAKNLRPGKVFIYWSQIAAAKTTVAPYSLRAQQTPTASTPLTWDEVEAVATGEEPARQYDAREVLERVEAYGDLLEGLLTPGPK